MADVRAKVAIGIPSRGLIHSRTIQSLISNAEGKTVVWLFAHGLAIPDCFNKLADEFLATNATHLWIVEEDMALPDNILEKMLQEKDPIVTVDYPVVRTYPTISKNGKYTLGGTGCILIKRKVFETIGNPYFRSIARDASTLQPIEGTVWGGQDMDFYIKAQDAGFKVTVMKSKVGQYYVDAMGVPQTNDGFHKITAHYL